jgi:NAD(P)-dependent dehydrogenase (short-subunit alcohol dehydrogenase family)
MTADYTGKVVVITGGAGGIGRALAHRFGKAGARIALLDRSEPTLHEAHSSLNAAGIDTLSVLSDVSDLSDCQRAMKRIADHFGGIDVLINNAGLTQVSPFLTTEVEVYRRVMEVNFFGAVHCTKAAIEPLIASRGQIIVTSSIAGFAPLLARTGYCASKHALHGFFDTLRAELRPQGVGVTLVCPAFTDTAFARSGLAGDGSTLTHERGTTGRLITPQEVAETVYRGALKRKPLVIVGGTGKLSWWVSRVAPGIYARMMTRRFQQDMQR